MKDLTKRQNEILGFIRSYAELHGFPPSVRDIGEQFGLYPATVHDHLRALERKGRLTRTPHQSRSLVLADTLSQTGSARAVETDPPVAVPVVGRVAAGTPLLAEENIEEHLELPQHWVPAGSFLLKVRGESMRDAHILDGDYVLVRPQQSAANGEIVVALIEDEATVKRYHRSRQAIELRPENPNFETIRLTASDSKQVAVLGRVVGVFRTPTSFH